MFSTIIFPIVLIFDLLFCYFSNNRPSINLHSIHGPSRDATGGTTTNITTTRHGKTTEFEAEIREAYLVERMSLYSKVCLRNVN
jgi:hypothetical protein